MKLPKNRQSRLSDDVWFLGEAIARYLRLSAARDGFEVSIRRYADQLTERDEKFSAILEAVKKESEGQN
jgi:hypothetical protein